MLVRAQRCWCWPVRNWNWNQQGARFFVFCQKCTLYCKSPEVVFSREACLLARLRVWDRKARPHGYLCGCDEDLKQSSSDL